MAQANRRLDSARMGELPEGKLLLSMAVPMMLSMLVQALYNVVDSIYVSQVSEDCLSALSLAFPAQNIMIGLGTGTGVGVSSLISRALGAGDRRQASKVGGTAVFLCFCCWALMALFGIFGAEAFIRSQTGDAAIRSYADSYLRIVTIGSLFLYLEICLERLLQSTGRTQLSMWTQMIGAVTNIILDPFFIYGWLGLPAMGTAGAALATVIGQAVAVVAGTLFHTRRNRELPIRISDIRPHWRLIGEIYQIGFPSILMMCIGSVTNYLMNRILIGFTSTAIAVYGAYFKIQSFFFMPVFGLNNGLIPVLAYNYGARQKERIDEALKFSFGVAIVIMLCGTAIMNLFPDVLLGFFNADEAMLQIGIPAQRIISLCFPLAAIGIISGSIFQAFSRSIYSLIISLGRQLVVLLPVAWLLSKTGDVTNVWWAFPIAEGVSVILSFIFFRKIYGQVVMPLGDPASQISK